MNSISIRLPGYMQRPSNIGAQYGYQNGQHQCNCHHGPSFQNQGYDNMYGRMGGHGFSSPGMMIRNMMSLMMQMMQQMQMGGGFGGGFGGGGFPGGHGSIGMPHFGGHQMPHFGGGHSYGSSPQQF